MALYLDADRVELLQRLAAQTGRTQQDVLREALDALLAKRKLLTPAKRSP